MTRTKNDFLDKLLQLRVAVAYLGEKDQCAWWSTQFLGNAGRRFLEFNYPRSAFAAGVTAVSEAAKALHDRRIGKGRVSHLFRLPHTMEQRLRAILLSSKNAELTGVIASRDAAILALTALAKRPMPATEGPIRVGDIAMLSSEGAIAKLAAFYGDAFTTAKQTLPYFTAEEG